MAHLQVDHSQCLVLYIGAFHNALVHLHAWPALQVCMGAEGVYTVWYDEEQHHEYMPCA